MSENFGNRHSKYRNFSEQEWNFKKSFSYDNYKGFSDLKIVKMQNTQRFCDMEEKFGLPFDLGFCRDFCQNNKRNRLLQRHLCSKGCFWNAEPCFMEQNHSGNLVDLMKKSFHEIYNPLFKSEFERNYSDKIDWSLTGGVGHYPSLGLNKLIAEMGITSNLSYDYDGCAVNLNNLSREFRDSDPVRPFYIMEEKKVHDIFQALLNVNSAKIESNKQEMQSIYDESYNASGALMKPILSLMMWGPLAGYDMQKTAQKCKFYINSRRIGTHVCANFTEKHYWMYSHGDKVECERGTIQQLSGPAMTHDMKVVYPCNNLACNQSCECDFCVLSLSCPKDRHKQHIRDLNQECEVQTKAQCQDHWVNHPENFDDKEDISVEKNIFHHNGVLVSQPRENAVEILKFSGIKRSCSSCCKDVKSHFKLHMVIHLQCKFCLYQLRTLFDKKFWEKVCNTCGKIFYNTSDRKLYWHKRIHKSDWSCDDCEIRLNRKWNLKRHLVEVHGLEFHELDVRTESETFNINKHEESVQNEQEKDLMNVTDEKKIHSCSICKESFTRHGDLERHLLEHSFLPEKHTCDICGKEYTRKGYLQQHIKLIHMKEETKFPCRFCEKEFNRKHNLTAHEKRMHGDK